jgi:hypothetical protein
VCGGFVLIEVDATVGKLSEGSLLLNLGSLNGVLYLEILAVIHHLSLDSHLPSSAQCVPHAPPQLPIVIQERE